MYWRFTVYFMVCMSMWVKTDSSHAFIRVCVCVPVSVHLIVFACVSFVTVSNCVRVIVSLFFTYVGFVFSLSFPACVCVGLLSQEVHWTLSLFLHISKQTVKRDAAQGWGGEADAHKHIFFLRTHKEPFTESNSSETVPPFCLEVSICWICDSNQNRT